MDKQYIVAPEIFEYGYLDKSGTWIITEADSIDAVIEAVIEAAKKAKVDAIIINGDLVN